MEKKITNKYVAFLLAAALIAVLLLYLPGADSVFLLDDYPNLSGVEGVSSWAEFLAYLNAGQAGPLGRPVSLASFSLIYLLSGELAPLPFKLVNIFLHALTGIAVYFFSVHLLRAFSANAVKGKALLVAVLWLFSAIHTSTVYYAVQQMTILSTLFSVLALIAYVRFRERAIDGTMGGKNARIAFFALVFLCLAVLSKENALFIVAVFMLLELAKYRFKKDAGWYYGLILLYLVAAGFVLSVLMKIGLASSLNYEGKDFTLFERLLTQSRVLWSYLLEIVLPQGVDIGFYHDDMPISSSINSPQSTLYALVAWFFVVSLLVYCFVTNRYILPAFGMSFYLLGHLMESTIFPLELYFEHRNYLPSVGVWLAVVTLLANGLKRTEIPTEVLSFFVLFYLALNAAIIWQEGAVWRSPEVRVFEAVRKHPNSERANMEFAYMMTLMNNLEQALLAYERIDKHHHSARVVTGVQRIWTYCVAGVELPSQLYNLTVKSLTGRRDLEYNTAWRLLLEQVVNGGCKSVSIEALSSNLRQQLTEKTDELGSARELWSSVYPLLVLLNKGAGETVDIDTARYFYRRGSYQSGFYLVGRLIETGDSIKARATLDGLVAAMSPATKEYFKHDIDRLKSDAGRLGNRNG